VREAAEASLARLAEAKQPAADEQLAAALCATSAGSLAGIDFLFTRAQARWAAIETEARRVLEIVRGQAAADIVAPHLESAERKERIAALHLLAGCGTADLGARVGRFLDDSDNSVRIAAINALRGIVDGDPPIDKLSVFDAIERANKWKARLQ
jgi:hypothetical protein